MNIDWGTVVVALSVGALGFGCGIGWAAHHARLIHEKMVVEMSNTISAATRIHNDVIRAELGRAGRQDLIDELEKAGLL